MSEPSIIVPDVIPTSTIVETTTTTHTAMGTRDETVQKLISLDWYIEEDSALCTTMKHRLIPGTTRYIKS